MTLEKQQLVQNAALDGHYQIVCRQLFAALNSWYITLVDVEDWEWEINEYRIFVGTREPPMIDEMNDYSVYYCGYNYYFIDNDGTVKRVVNVNFTEYGEQYTSFLKCSKIQTDYLYSNETGFIQVKDSLELDKNLKVHGTATIDLDTEIGGKTLISDNLTVQKSVEISDDLKIGGTTDIIGNTSLSADLNVDGDLRLKGNLTGNKDATFDKNVNVGVQVKTPKVLVDTVARTSGTDNISFENGISTTGGLVVDKSAQIKTDLNVLGVSKFTKDVEAFSNLSVEGDLKLKGDFINTGNVKANGEMVSDGDMKAPGFAADRLYKFSGTGNIKVSNGMDVTGGINVSDTTKTKSLTVTNNASMGSASVSGDLNVSGAINGLKIRVV